MYSISGCLNRDDGDDRSYYYSVLKNQWYLNSSFEIFTEFRTLFVVAIFKCIAIMAI